MKMLMDYATVVRNCGPVPPAVYEAIKRYIEEGIEPGGFVRACLENDLQMAVMRADSTNRERLQEICWMITAAIPSQAYGSSAKVRAWADGGFKSLDSTVYRDAYNPMERAD